MLFLAVQLLDAVTPHSGNQTVGLLIEIGGFFSLAGNNQRGSGFVDENGVHLVHNGKGKVSLHQISLVNRHVVPQVVKAELVVGAVGDVTVVGRLLFGIGLTMADQSGGQPQKSVNSAHFLATCAGKIFVDSDHMNAFARQRIQVCRQGGHQSFSFAGLHFGDLPLVQDDAAQKLNPEGTLGKHAPVGFPDQCKGLRQKIVQRFPLPEPFLKRRSHGLQFGIAHLFVNLSEFVDLSDGLVKFFQEPLAVGAEHLIEQFHLFCFSFGVL